jgi:hypothetical protein
MAYAETLRFSSEVKQLKNLMDQIAAKSTELITLTLTTNASSKVYMQMPIAVGNKQYWLQLYNDSASAWIEGGFGDMPITGTELQVYLPKEISATGYYVGGYGVACLACGFDAGALRIELKSSG